MDDINYDRIYRHGAEHGYDIAKGVLVDLLLELRPSDPAWEALNAAFKRLQERKADEIARTMGDAP